MAALQVVGLWLAISGSVGYLLGCLPKVWGRYPGTGPVVLALHLFFLTLITDKAGRAVSTPTVSVFERWACLALGVALVGGSFLLVRQGLPGRMIWEILTTCGQILIVGVAATYLPRFLIHPNELVPLIGVMVCADAFSFLAGPTHFIATDVADYYLSGGDGIYPVSAILLMKFATPGSTDLLPFFGVADWFMVVFLSAGARRFGLNDRVMGIPLAVLGLFLAVSAAQILGLFLPALPVLALFFLIGMGCRYGAALRPGKREILLTLVSPLVAGILLILR